MRSRRRVSLPADLEAAQGRFLRWRRLRDRPRRIPEALWSTAVRLAGVHGVCRTAQALGLDYNSLKKRLTKQASAGSAGHPAGASFVELLPPSMGVPESVVELEDPDGTKLRVHIKGGQVPDVVALVARLRDRTR